ncbi:MAG: class B sortase, partial [Peptostreptococcaceae bacterium]
MKINKNIIILIPLIIIFVWSSSQVLIYFNEGNKNKNIMKDLGIELTLEEPSDSTSPLEYTKGVMSNRISTIKSLQEKNSDIIGWIYIYGTKIDYPILQSKDNSYYLYRNVEKESSKYGSIFMDYRNTIDELEVDNNSNIVLYGHKMKNKQMFGTLDKFSDKEYFNSRPTIAIILNDKEYYFEAFSSYVTSKDDNYIETSFNSEEEFHTFVDKLSSKSHTKTDVNTSSLNKILTLSTCSYD